MGGVWVCYRNEDAPLGATAIHDQLRLRFGAANVFRDPPAGHDRVAAVGVLLAMIGPRWLTSVNGDGARLTRRNDDLVHRCLAMAFRDHVPVLPVLLRGRHALPQSHLLPLDVRPLGTIDPFGVDDPERLVRTVARITGLPAAPSRAAGRPGQMLFFAMVDALERIPSLGDERDRTLLVNLLPRAIAGAVTYSGRRRSFVIHLLNACRDHPDGLAHLIDVLRDINGDDCLPLRHLQQLVTQFVATEGV